MRGAAGRDLPQPPPRRDLPHQPHLPHLPTPIVPPFPLLRMLLPAAAAAEEEEEEEARRKQVRCFVCSCAHCYQD